MRLIKKKLMAIDEAEEKTISSFLDTHFSTVFHEPAFNKILSEVFGTEFSYYIAYDLDDNMIGICPIHSIKRGALRELHSGMLMHDVPYGGWIYENGVTNILELMSRMKLAFNENLTYWSIPQLQTDTFTFLRNKREFQTGIIDLSASLDEILQNIERKRRQDIIRAERKGVEVEKLKPQNLDVFLDQCRNLKESIQADPFPDELFIRLFSRYYDSGKIIGLATKLNGEYLASGVLIGNRHMAHLWIAGKPKSCSVHVPRQDSLLWESIKWAKEAGSRYYDLCVVEAERLPQIAQFKLSFSKTLVPFYYLTQRKLGYRLLSKIQKWAGRQSRIHSL
jgi:hypothetical protein